MTQTIFLREDLSPDEANIVESISDANNYFLSGIMMTAEQRNGNNRIYDLNEMATVVESTMKLIEQKGPVLGELNHPDTLQINPYNASHCITEMRMDGNNVVGKMKILNTPCGNIVKGIMEGGVRLGVSSRGTGSVGSDGRVKGFNFVTVDVVVNPSAQNAYPNLVKEAQENRKIVTLAEAMVEDKKAQKYLEKEIKSFLAKLISK